MSKEIETYGNFFWPVPLHEYNSSGGKTIMNMELMRKGLTVAIFGAFLGVLTACDDGPAEEAGEAIDNAAEETGDAVEDATD
jgi:hypothetical protein